MARASSSEISGRMSRRSSSRPAWAKRKPPAVKKELPPRWDSGAFSSTSTEAPASRAASAAQSAALPVPATTTSCVMSLAPSDESRQHRETEGDAVPPEDREAVGLDPAQQPAHHEERGDGRHEG